MRVDFSRPRFGYTKRLEKYVLTLLRSATMKDVAKLVGLGWDAVKEIQKRYLQKRFRLPRLKGVRRIAIDEICIGKGHKYLTVVLDLDKGRVLFVGDGKGGDAKKGVFSLTAPSCFWHNLLSFCKTSCFGHCKERYA